MQQPIATSIFEEVMGDPAWKTLPSWYLVAANDQALPPDAEREFATRMGAVTVEKSPAASGWDLTSQGERKLPHLRLDAAALQQNRRPFLRPCLDWTERRPHLAGMLGQALAGRLLDLDWVRRSSRSRALVIIASGER